MKIVIVGAHGTGKTTLANDIAKKTKFAVLPEVARLLAAEGHKLDGDVTLETEREIFKRQLLIESQNQDYVSDRCLIDVRAYVGILFSKEESFILEMNNSIKNAKYDLIFYLSPEFPIENDGVRSLNVEFQNQIDKEIKDILAKNSLEYKLLTGNKQKRLEDALKHLTSVK